MAHVTSSGAALFRRIDGALHFLAVESRSERGYWGLVKGHVEAGESIAEAARREIAEEVGLRDVSFLPGFREEVRYRLPSGDDKVVYYFLADAGTGRIRLQAEEIADCRWLPFPAVCELFTFPEAGRVVERAARFLEAEGGDRDAGEHALTRPHVAALDEILGRRLDVALSDKEIAERLAAWSPPAPRYPGGVMAKYAAQVSSASAGAVTSVFTP